MLSKKNYAAERKEAAGYADKVMNRMPKALTSLEREKQLDAWGYAYAGYLAGLRAGLRR
jgi:hypothetical protein